MNTNDDTIEIDLQELFGLLLSRLWLIIICTVVGGVAAFIVSNFFVTPLYQSTTSVYILNKNENSTVSYSDLQLGTQLTKDYAQMITSRDVLEGVIEKCDLDEGYGSFSSRVSVTTPSDTRMIKITVTDENPVMAQLLANEVRKLAADKIKEVMDIEAVNTVDEANLPTSPASPSVGKWTMVGGAVGMVLCIMIVLIRFLMDDSIKTSEDVEKYLELSTLASIPVKEDTEKKKSKFKLTAAGTAATASVRESDREDEEEEEVTTAAPKRVEPARPKTQGKESK